MITTLVQRELQRHAALTKRHQDACASELAQARYEARYGAVIALGERSKSAANSGVNYQACTQKWEPLFAETLGTTEDFKAACTAARCTEAAGERALRNPHVCVLAEAKHREVCQKLIDVLNAQLALAQPLLEQSEDTYQHLKGTAKGTRAFGQFYDDEKRVKKMRSLRDALDLRKQRAAFAFQNTKWQGAAAVR